MAEGATSTTGGVDADPQTLRAEIAQTRADLSRELGALKSQLLGSPARREGTKSMATKKAKTKSGSKSSKSKKSTGRKAVKKVARKVATKAKKVLGEMAARAAVGAVKGAAEALASQRKGKGDEESRRE